MLKIKDNVDLKELEKFGFKRIVVKRPNPCHLSTDKVTFYQNIEWCFNCVCCGIDIHEERKNNNWRYGFEIRELNIWNEYDCAISDKVFNVLFDIIQAGLVEKVEAQDGSVGD